jgi:hypothetical protein
LSSTTREVAAFRLANYSTHDYDQKSTIIYNDTCKNTYPVRSHASIHPLPRIVKIPSSPVKPANKPVYSNRFVN